jgi:hypothetical protein
VAITTQFCTGFEHGFLGAAAAAGGGLTGTAVITGAGWSAPASPRNGAYCARLVAPANTANWFAVGPVLASAKVVERFAVKVSSRPTSGDSTIATGTITGGVLPAFKLTVSSTGVLKLICGATVTGPTIDTTNWHLIEVQINTSANPWTADWKVDGVLQTQATNALAATTVASVALGNASQASTVGTQAAFTADYDDVIVGTWNGTAATDWYGDGKVLGQIAGVDGTHNTVASFSFGDAGAALSGTVTTAETMVDDPPATGGWSATRDATDNLALRVATVAAYLEVKPEATSELGQANAVRAIMSYSSSTTTANLAGCDARNSAGVVTALRGLTGGVGAGFNVTANNFGGGIVTAPAAGWTAAEVNAVRFRFGGCTSVDISPVPTVQAMMLEVDWPVRAPQPRTAADTVTISDSAGAVVSSPPTFGGSTTLIDDFNRADSTSAGGAFSTTSSITGQGASLAVKDNAAAPGNFEGQNCPGSYTTASYGPDVELALDITVMEVGAYVRHYTRLQNVGSVFSLAGYEFEFFRDATLSCTCTIKRIFDGTFGDPVLASVVLPVASFPTKVGIQSIGLTHRAWLYINGSWVLAAEGTDPNDARTISAAGPIGLGGKQGATVGGINRFDNLRGGAYVTTKAPIPRTATDSWTVSDSATAVKGSGPASFPRTATDTVTVGDAAVRAPATRPRTATDTVTMLDSAAARAGQVRTADDVNPISDTANRAPATRARPATDTVVFSDVANRAPSTRTRTATDTIAFSDVANRAPASQIRPAADAVVFSDVADRAPATRTRTAVDVITFSDVANRAPRAVPRTANDSWTISDVANRAPSTRTRPATDSWTVSDSAGRVLGPATVTLVSQTRTKISRVSGYDVTDVVWTSSQDFIDYQFRVVPSAASDITAGAQIEFNQNPTSGGTASTQYTSSLTDAEIEAVSPAEGAKIIKLFVRNEGGWSS